ncbi:MAG: hypothetical protein WA885_04010 [Phormidesmis sp.]
MARISLDIPDELLKKLTDSGKNPDSFFQERLLTLSTSALPEPSLTERFQTLASQWKHDTRHVSLMSDIVLNKAYQQIIGMGKPAIPLLLKALKEQPDHWFWALRSITGENPISPDDRGHLPKMAEAWLKWGKAHGYQC